MAVVKDVSKNETHTQNSKQEVNDEKSAIELAKKTQKHTTVDWKMSSWLVFNLF